MMERRASPRRRAPQTYVSLAKSARLIMLPVPRVRVRSLDANPGQSRLGAAENPIHPSEKRTRSGSRFRATLAPVVIQPFCEIKMKFCPNYSCVAYGRVTYTQATRCAFCRWDLKPPRLKSETLIEQQVRPEPAPEHSISPSKSSPSTRMRLKANLLPHTA